MVWACRPPLVIEGASPSAHSPSAHLPAVLLNLILESSSVGEGRLLRAVGVGARELELPLEMLNLLGRLVALHGLEVDLLLELEGGLFHGLGGGQTYCDIVTKGEKDLVLASPLFLFMVAC